MKTIVISVIGAVALTACGPQQIPDSGQGVGFNDYGLYELERAEREVELRGGTPFPTAAPSSAPIVPPNVQTPLSPPVSNGVSTSDLAAAGINTNPSGTPSTGTIAATPAPTPAAVTPAPLEGNSEISDEQSFNAVSSRESIESDAQRRERQAAAYQLIEVTSLPNRNGTSEPNIVQYALQAPNNRGESVFSRSGFSRESKFVRNCAQYRTPDDAQRDFISRGGPQRDRLGIDPDGDGFACGWDPQAFRTLAGN